MNYFIKGDLVEGIFLKRLNRFVAEVLVDNKKRLSHVPNTGRMKELLVKG
ncbi:MAG: sugar fermentation stimulation protein SfsA, partial [Firmicutes bacterium]|nr:sugar fermentation stimulation protein SfsA [Bacillota bacterium]